jgi:toxin ParE1/3/4
VKRFEVLLTEGAERDLDELCDYLAEFVSPAKVEQLLRRLLATTERLARFPERGAWPKELLALGIREYRQTFIRPYRVIYRVIGKRVFVHLIVDGRREMQTLLARRLLGA